MSENRMPHSASLTTTQTQTPSPTTNPTPEAPDEPSFYAQPDLQQGAALTSPTQVYAGRVLDEDGQPIEGVLVELHHDSDRSALEYRDHHLATTDAQGCWRATRPADGMPWEVDLFHPDFIGTIFHRSSQTPAREQLLSGTAVMVMKRGCFIHGQVQDEDGRPIPHAVVLTQIRVYHTLSQPVEDPTMSRTDEQGRFRTCALPAGPRELVVYAPGHAAQVVPVDVRQQMDPVTVQLGKGETVHGHIRNWDGTPIVGASVAGADWYAPECHPSGAETRTDENGWFELAHLPTQGIYCIRYDLPGGNFWPGWAERPAGSPPDPLEITLERARVAIKGQVLDDATNQPITEFDLVPGWPVLDDSDLSFDPDRARHVKSADGAFEMELCDEEMVRVMASGYVPYDTSRVELGRPETIAIRLKPGDPIVGAVLTPDGNPAAEAQVVWVSPRRTAQIEDGKIRTLISGLDPHAITVTDRQGHFEFPAYRDPATIVVAHPTGYAMVPSSEKGTAPSIRLTAWARIEGVAMTGQTPAPGEIVGVHVHWENFFAPGRWDNLTQEAQLDGSFAFDHVPCVQLAVGRTAWPGLSHAVRLTPEPGRTYQVQIGGPGGTVEGRLETPPGVDLDCLRPAYSRCTDGVQIEARSPSSAKEAIEGVRYVPVRDKEGLFRLNDLPPGRYELTASVGFGWTRGTQAAMADLVASPTHFEVPDPPAQEPLVLPPLALDVAVRIKVADNAPEINISSLDGREFRLSRLRGGFVVLDFWTVSSRLWLAQMPRLRDLWRQYGQSGMAAFVGVNLGRRVELARGFVSKYELPWLQAPTDRWRTAREIMAAYGITAIPSYWLIGPDGRIIAADVREIDALGAILNTTIRRGGH